MIVIVGMFGLLLLSPRGKQIKEQYLDRYVTIVGNFFKGKLVRTGVSPSEKFQMTIKTDLSSLSEQSFEIQGSEVQAELKPDSASIGNLNIGDVNSVEFKTIMDGVVALSPEGRITLSGYSDSIELNGVMYTSKGEEKRVDFSLSGIPLTFTLGNVRKNLVFPQISGSLEFDDKPLSLDDDKLDVINFEGSLEFDGETLSIVGEVDNVIINDKISLSSVVES